MKVYGGICRYMEVYDGIWRYMKVYEPPSLRNCLRPAPTQNSYRTDTPIDRASINRSPINRSATNRALPIEPHIDRGPVHRGSIKSGPMRKDRLASPLDRHRKDIMSWHVVTRHRRSKGDLIMPLLTSISKVHPEVFAGAAAPGRHFLLHLFNAVDFFVFFVLRVYKPWGVSHRFSHEISPRMH